MPLNLVRCASLFFLFTGFSYALEFKSYPIVSEKRLELTRHYAKVHYGIDSYRLESPRMIVVHYTAIPTRKSSLEVFKPDTLAAHRREISNHGQLNVGVHFLVDSNGDIYSLLPLNTMGRHVIGFNHTAIGIENVGASEKDLTKAQLEANVVLVTWLKKKFSSVTHLIGHHEYMRKNLPHFSLYIERDKTYRPTIKTDPGERFMSDLRNRLERSGISLEN